MKNFDAQAISNKYFSPQEEQRLWKSGYRAVAGLDEVGRGPLAGPIVACAVMILPEFKKTSLLYKRGFLADSKKLTPRMREKIYKTLINSQSIYWGIGKVYPRVIDRINILKATKLAMTRAVQKLSAKKRKIDFLILDGKLKLNLPIQQQSIIKADEKIFSCAAASIIAKVKRDKAMFRYHKKYPQYKFDRHKGYGTEVHLKILKKLGRCAIHRNSFKF